MNFELSADQKLLRDTARTFVKQKSPVGRFRRLRDDGGGWQIETWREMGELGWLGLPHPEQAGGFGGSMVDAAVLLEAFGTTLVPEPYVASVVLAGTILAEAGDAAQCERWLSPMLDGRTSLAVAWAERGSRFDARDIAAVAERTSKGTWHLRANKVFVQNGDRADHIVVTARTGSDLGLFLVDRDTAGVEITRVRTIDGLGAAMVAVEGEIDGDRRLGDGATGAAVLAHALDRAAAGTCAESLGVCQAVLDMTVAHLRTREQFGSPIGSFQALQHRAVEMFVEVELMRSVAVLAAITTDASDAMERARGVSAAKAQVAMSGRFVTHQAIQLHGGIGITDEHDVGLYFKRMHALGLAFGDEEHHVRRFATLPSFVAGV